MDFEQLVQDEKDYVVGTYRRIPMALVNGKGARVWDQDGNEYLDFLAGIAVNNVGHCHPKVVNALCTQATQLLHVSNLYYIEPQVQLARRLSQSSLGGRVFFGNSGAEAIEGSIKLARKWGYQKGIEAPELIVFFNSFHGRTLGALAATGQTKYHKGFAPLPPGFRLAQFNDLASVENQLTDSTVAILVEPVQGEGGVYPADPDFLEGLRQLTLSRDMLLMFDEIQTGFGRTGPLFAYQGCSVTPDVMALAKGIAGGVPMGALVTSPRAADVLQPGDHASTFGGNPLASAAGLAVLEVLIDDGLLERAGETGDYLGKSLTELGNDTATVREVRGRGMMWGLDLVASGGALVEQARQKGLLINCTADTVLRLVPPLTVSRDEIDRAVSILAEVLSHFTPDGQA